jgi:chromosome segregation ATPase
VTVDLPAFLATVRSEVSPHLAFLGHVEQKAAADSSAAEQDLARWIAGLICAESSHQQDELAAIMARLDDINTKLEKIAMSQSDIDAATAEITSIVTDVQAQIAQLGSDFTAIQTEIQALQSQGVDTTALDAAVAQAQSTMSGLDPAVAQITTLAPAAPAPASDVPPAS